MREGFNNKLRQLVGCIGVKIFVIFLCNFDCCNVNKLCHNIMFCSCIQILVYNVPYLQVCDHHSDVYLQFTCHVGPCHHDRLVNYHFAFHEPLQTHLRKVQLRVQRVEQGIVQMDWSLVLWLERI